jgi:hypothetical protein
LDDPENGKLDHGQFFACLLLERFYGSEEFGDCTETERLILFLVLVAAFRHDEWSKPEALKEQRGWADDPWSVLFSFVDLLAEMRLIWHASPVPGDSGANWAVKMWVPFSRIEVNPHFDSDWTINFDVGNGVRQQMKEKGLSEKKEDWETWGFRFPLSCGFGPDPQAADKRNQYAAMLRSLGLLSDPWQVDVKMD